MERVDLLQLHCPHPEVYERPEVFGILDDMVKAGKLRYYGISVETVDEALRGIRHPGVQSVQIVFNMLRLKPAEAVFDAANAHGVGILARVPLASGLLSGKMTKHPRSRPTTTASLIATASRSTKARPSRACRSRWALRWSNNFVRSSRPAPRSRSSPCAGS